MQASISYSDPKQALALIQSGNRVFVQGSAQTPNFLLRELAGQAGRLKDVELVFISLYGDVHVNKPDLTSSFRLNSLFVSAAIRDAVEEGLADYVPVFLSEIPELFIRKILPLDVAIVQVSPPDHHGFCSLGVSVDVSRAAVHNARYVIAQVNPRVPRTHGDGLIHVGRIQALVACDEPLHEARFGENAGEAEMKIGAHIAGMIEDRSTLQMGIGSIPDAVLKSLHNHKDLGIHTEMCSDGIIPLLEKGVINNRYKPIHTDKSVVGFALGSRKLYDLVDDNPAFAFLDIDYVNDPYVIRRNPRMVAINSAIEIDLTGQVCADSIGTYQYSGVGGQMDFMRGASLSEGGLPIIALTSRTAKGLPRINPCLKQGAGVVTTRAHVHHVVTEYGIASLFGKNLRQRAKALVGIAHPDDRERLDKACFERFRKY
jgi:acyl-CoA hydrolase